jgi:hypothetical protein
MSLALYINNEKVDLEPSQVIAQTKQVNDLNSIDSRDASYTNTFKLPKTANNVRIMQYMTLPGNVSMVPYKRNNCTLYSSTGECFIYNGWAIVTDGGKTYDVVVIDGIIDFYKAIENKNLSDLDLSALVHQKTVIEVLSTWSQVKPYKYILADYNGDTGNVNTDEGITPSVNIDYLVPSVNVSWLWDKVFTTFNCQYFGTVFNTYNFKELWMTFPKGQLITGENDHTIFKSDNYVFQSPGATGHWFAKWNSTIVNELLSNFNNIHMQVAESATYRIRVKGKLFGYKDTNLSMPQNGKIRLGKNGQEASSNTEIGIPTFKVVADNIPSGEDFEYSPPDIFQLNELDTICVIVTRATEAVGGYLGLNTPNNKLEVEFYRVDPNEIDFSQAFSDFPIKDFINEVVQRFGLTIFKGKYEQKYTFLTLNEQLVSANTVDWSSKFSKKLTENYIYGTYAQQNYFRYNYNDKESTHNDSFILVNNVNLQDKKDLVKSKIYSPERLQTRYLNEPINVYKIWDKEVVEDPAEGEDPIKYNPLDKRYYFLRSVQRTGLINVISKRLALTGTATLYYRENYYNLPFADILQDYYAPLRQIFTRAAIVNAELYLNDIDVSSFDFKKLYFFSQLGNYYLMNKINNYIPGRPTKCEMVRVMFEDLADPPKAVKITKVIVLNNAIKVTYELSVNVNTLALQYSLNQTSWSSTIFQSFVNPVNFNLPSAGVWYIRIKAGNEFSNVVQLTTPSTQIIIP